MVSLKQNKTKLQFTPKHMLYIMKKIPYNNLANTCKLPTPTAFYI